MRASPYLLLLCSVAAAAQTKPSVYIADTSLPKITANNNRVPGGHLHNGVLTIGLEARSGIWYPEARGGPGLQVQAFGEPGGSLEIPGPLIRVPEGTVINVSIRNRIPGATLVIHGLHTRPGNPDDVVQVAPKETREVRFKAGEPGTYYYWVTTTGMTLKDPRGVDSQLTGALIVDQPERTLADRVFVMGWWVNPAVTGGDPFAKGRNAIVINGRSWPYTEQLTYKVGDVVHWRWINANNGNHPMHLHGSYYRVDSTGDVERDNIFSDQERRMAVTELMQPGSTMSLTWTPQSPGNWLFHCHVLTHISPHLRLRPSGKEVHGSHNASQHATEGMAGLVLGVHVLPSTIAPKLDRNAGQPRQLRLVAQLQPGRYGKDPGFAFALHEGSFDAEQDSGRIPGPPIVLTRGQPVEITVVNKLSEPTSVHWHGMELESYYDGIAGWSGTPGHLAPMILPDSSFVAKFTPPRAGTFIYHTHVDDIRQLSSGLYGAMIVLEPGQSFEPVTDKIMLLSVLGPTDNTPILLNGSAEPSPIELQQGTKYRFRFINITPHDPRLTVSLLSGSSLVNWREVAKDGADLPALHANLRPARQIVSVGETYDFDFEPTSAEDLRLEIFRPARVSNPESQMLIPVRVY
jgi:FtsP/CotA-like multicopper oxidase with cupredoxin domain